MTTAEKIKLYQELHPNGSAFPLNKKPDERPEDMEWLDKKLTEFQALKDKKAENSDQNTAENPQPAAPTEPSTPEVKLEVNQEAKKVYTVDQIKCLPDSEFKAIQQMVADGLARVVN